MSDRTCPACSRDMSHLSLQWKHCSSACRRWTSRGHTGKRPIDPPCKTCGKTIVGRNAAALYCSKLCKTRAVEARRVRDDAARYLREREHRLAYATAYAKANPHIGQANKRRRRVAHVEGYRFTGRDWLQMQRRHGNRCYYCQTKGALTMDHVIPIIRGGTHGEGNIVPACSDCNSRKQGRFVMEWRMGKSRKAKPRLELAA